MHWHRSPVVLPRDRSVIEAIEIRAAIVEALARIEADRAVLARNIEIDPAIPVLGGEAADLGDQDRADTAPAPVARDDKIVDVAEWRITPGREPLAELEA